MKTVTIDGFIATRPSILGEGANFHFFQSKMDEHGFITVMPHSFTVDIPDDFNILAAQVQSLEAKREALRKEFNARIAQINDEIKKLQCLEFTPSEPA